MDAPYISSYWHETELERSLDIPFFTVAEQKTFINVKEANSPEMNVRPNSP